MTGRRIAAITWYTELTNALIENGVPRGRGPGFRYENYERGKRVMIRWRDKKRAGGELLSFEACLDYLVEYLKA